MKKEDLKFNLAPTQKFMTTERLMQLEESINYVSHTTKEMAQEAYLGTYVFVNPNGEVSKHSGRIAQLMISIAKAQAEKEILFELLKEEISGK